MLCVDAVYRFKGLQAATDIFAEIGFETITPTLVNRLYIGMTQPRTR